MSVRHDQIIQMLNGNYKLESTDFTVESEQKNCHDEEKKMVVEAGNVQLSQTNTVPKEMDRRNVLVRLFGDKTVSISFNSNDTVAAVKDKIQDISGYPAKIIQLKVGKTPIRNDDAIMAQFNIVNDDIIHAVTYNTSIQQDPFTYDITPNNKNDMCVLIQALVLNTCTIN